MNNFCRIALPLIVSGAAMAGCTTTGMGEGELTQKGKQEMPVTFQWTSTDGGITGTMTAELPGGARYSGVFYQITPRARVETITPLWEGWSPGWYDWPYWSVPPDPAYAGTAFITQYTGKVLANLHGADATPMRCRFHLLDPVGGMAGGGQGECQLRGGRLIRANFPAN